MKTNFQSQFSPIFTLIPCRGFSTVDLVSEAGTDRLYALKKIRCHSIEDEQDALREINYHKQINHPGVIQCVGSLLTGKADIVSNQTSQVLLLLPFYKVIPIQIFCKNNQTMFWSTVRYTAKFT